MPDTSLMYGRAFELYWVISVGVDVDMLEAS